MAKLLFSSLVDGVRGRAGGIVFSANGAGPHVKRFAPPIYKNSSSQNARRNEFSTWPARWRNLSPTQQSDWNAYASNIAQIKYDSLGNAYYLNGFQWFVACGTNAGLCNRAYSSNAPVIATPVAPTIGTLIIASPGSSGNSQAVTVASFGTDDCVIQLNWSIHPGRGSFIERNYKFIVGFQNAGLSATLNLGNLESIFGSLSSGTYWNARVYAQTSEGRRGDFASSYATAT